MFFDNLDNSSLVINSDHSGFIATVRLWKNVSLLLFLGVFLVAFIPLAGIALIKININSHYSGFELLISYIIPLIFYLWSALFFGYVWFWNLVGEEIIQGNHQRLLVTYRIFGLRRTKTFSMQAISDLHINISKPSFFDSELHYKRLGLSGDAIFFKTNQTTYHFGRRLSLENASKLVEVIDSYRSE